MKLGNSWSLTSIVVFQSDPPRVDPGWGQYKSQGVLFFKELPLKSGRQHRQTNEYIAIIQKYVRSVVNIGSVPKSKS